MEHLEPMAPMICVYVAAYYYASTDKTEQVVVHATNEIEALLKVIAHWDQFRLSSYRGSAALVYRDSPTVFVNSRFSMIKLTEVVV
jgi:hypothetical protein